jgi:hypothetical protein
MRHIITRSCPSRSSPRQLLMLRAEATQPLCTTPSRPTSESSPRQHAADAVRTRCAAIGSVAVVDNSGAHVLLRRPKHCDYEVSNWVEGAKRRGRGGGGTRLAQLRVARLAVALGGGGGIASAVDVLARRCGGRIVPRRRRERRLGGSVARAAVAARGAAAGLAVRAGERRARRRLGRRGGRRRGGRGGRRQLVEQVARYILVVQRWNPDATHHR